MMKLPLAIMILLSLSWATAKDKKENDPNLALATEDKAFLDAKRVRVNLATLQACDGKNCPDPYALDGNFTESGCDLKPNERSGECRGNSTAEDGTTSSQETSQ